LITGALGIPALIYLLVPPRSRNKEEWVEVTELSKLTPGDPEEIVFRRNRQDGWKLISEKASAWVVRTGDREVVAFSPICTHLGCAYHWDERNKNFLCPCHTSTFGIDGKVLSGPAPRPLDRYHARVEGDKLLLGSVAPSEEV
jgi:menaquinol-cytochrome c reductase iron-sulfur subunit